MNAEWIAFFIVLLIIIGAIIGVIYRKRKGKLGNYNMYDDNGPGGITDLMD